MSNVGYATLTVIPSFAGFQAKLATGMAAPLAASASRAGATAGATASKGFASKFQSGLGNLGPKLFAGIGIAALGKQVIGVQAEFEQSMNVLKESADVPAASMQRLSDFAKDMGAKTVFSAGEAADAMVELAKAGIKPAQIQTGALKATMNVAATEGLNLADSATIISNAMTTFKLKGSQATEAADALAGGSKASTASVASLSEAMRQVGGSAVDAGLSIQETVAALSAFDSEGIKGSDAGTALKTMLSRLVPQTEGAAEKMRELGLRFTDAKGEFLPIANVAEQLRTKIGPLSDAERTLALNTIFGSDARRAAIALMHQGSAGMAKFTKATSDQGAAQRLANARMSGTAGALEALSGQIETAELALGEALQPAVIASTGYLGDLAGLVGKAATAFGNLPGPIQTTVGALAAFKISSSLFGFNPTGWSTSMKRSLDGVRLRTMMAADAYKAARVQTVLMGSTSVSVASSVGRTTAAMKGVQAAAVGMGSGLKRAVGGMSSAIGGPWAVAIAAGITALTIFASKNADAAADAQELKDSLDQQTGAVTKNTRAWAASKLADDGFMDNVKELGLDASFVTSAMLDQGKAAGQLSTKLDGIVEAAKRRNNVDGSVYYTSRGMAAKELLKLMGETNTSLSEQAREAKFVADATDKQGAAVKGVGDEARTAAQFQEDYNSRMEAARERVTSAKNAVLDLIDAYNKQRDATLKNRRDQLGLNQTLIDAHDEARKGKKTLDENTQAGIDNWNALLDVADQWNNSSNKVRNAHGAWKQTRQDFIAIAESMGASSKRAHQLADDYLNLPSRITVKVDDKGITQAEKHARALKELMIELRRLGNQRLKLLDPSSGRTTHGLQATGYATGGKIGGAGSGTSDSNVLRGSRGEWMIRERASRYYGDAFMSALNNMQLPKGAGGGGGVQVQIGTVVAHDYGDFMRQTQRRTRRANAGGVNFR